MSVSLASFDESDPKSIINSPRSLRACKQEGVLPGELVHKPVESFHERNLSPRLVKLRYDFFEAKRRDLLAASRRARDGILAEERREKESSSQALDLIAKESGLSKGTIMALNSDGLKAERQKLLRAQERERDWLKNALNNELRQLKEIEKEADRTQSDAGRDLEKQAEIARRMKDLNDKKQQEDERKQIESEARQRLEKQIAKEEFLKAQEELRKKEEFEALKVKDAYERQLREMEKKKVVEVEKAQKKEALYREQEAKKAEMRAQDLRKRDIMEQQKTKFLERMAEKKQDRDERVAKGMETNMEMERRRREEFERKLQKEQECEERLAIAREEKQEECAKRAFQQMMRRRVIQEEAHRRTEERREAILDQQEETEMRLLDHEQKKERYLDFKRELDGLRATNKVINVERQRRRVEASRELVAEQVKKKDEKIDAINNERKRLWQIRKAQQTEAYRARELVKSEIMRQRIASKYNSKVLEQKMRDLDLMGGSSSMPSLRASQQEPLQASRHSSEAGF